jgi:hypothetical protein
MMMMMIIIIIKIPTKTGERSPQQLPNSKTKSNKKHCRIKQNNPGENVGRTDRAYDKDFIQPKQIPNNLPPKVELRPTVADTQMPRGTTRERGRKPVREKVKGRVM